MRRALRTSATALATLLLLGACSADPSPTDGTPSSSAAATGASSVTPEPTSTPPATPEPTPTPEPEPTLGLVHPQRADGLTVTVSVAPQVDAEGGTITVTVTSEIETRIDELVVRWPQALAEALLLRPFEPSADRLRPGAPLVQPWTKWVVGPGEEGEPEGTVSLGYGPLLPGATLTIPIDVVRTAAGPVAFDLQVLSDNDLLSLPDGEPAELRVEIP